MKSHAERARETLRNAIELTERGAGWAELSREAIWELHERIASGLEQVERETLERAAKVVNDKAEAYEALRQQRDNDDMFAQRAAACRVIGRIIRALAQPKEKV